MRNVLKAETLERKFPLLSVENGCIVSKDIGMYDTCMHFCAYCYANASRKTVLENRRRHDPESPFLAGEPGKTNEDAKAENTENGGGR